MGNIAANPQFVDPDNGDFRLSPGSPCIDSGDNTAVPRGVLRDLDGDGIVGVLDLMLLLSQVGPCAAGCYADIDGDGMVGVTDLLIVLGNWG